MITIVPGAAAGGPSDVGVLGEITTEFSSSKASPAGGGGRCEEDTADT